MDGLTQSLVSLVNLGLSLAIFALVVTLKRAWPEFVASRAGQRALPVIPMLLGVILALAGFRDAAVTRWQDVIVVGLLSGAFAASIFKIGRTSVLGKGLEAAGLELPEDPPKAAPAPAPLDPPPPSAEGGA